MRPCLTHTRDECHSDIDAHHDKQLRLTKVESPSSPRLPTLGAEAAWSPEGTETAFPCQRAREGGWASRDRARVRKYLESSLAGQAPSKAKQCTVRSKRGKAM